MQAVLRLPDGGVNVRALAIVAHVSTATTHRSKSYGALPTISSTAMSGPATGESGQGNGKRIRSSGGPEQMDRVLWRQSPQSVFFRPSRTNAFTASCAVGRANCPSSSGEGQDMGVGQRRPLVSFWLGCSWATPDRKPPWRTRQGQCGAFRRTLPGRPLTDGLTWTGCLPCTIMSHDQQGPHH